MRHVSFSEQRDSFQGQRTAGRTSDGGPDGGAAGDTDLGVVVNPLLEQGLVEVTVVKSVGARAAGEDGRAGRNKYSLHIDPGLLCFAPCDFLGLLLLLSVVIR